MQHILLSAETCWAGCLGGTAPAGPMPPWHKSCRDASSTPSTFYATVTLSFAQHQNQHLCWLLMSSGLHLGDGRRELSPSPIHSQQLLSTDETKVTPRSLTLIRYEKVITQTALSCVRQAVNSAPKLAQPLEPSLAPWHWQGCRFLVGY